MGDWWDQQGVPGGAVAPIEPGYTPQVTGEKVMPNYAPRDPNEPRAYTQAFVYGPDGSYRVNGDPNGQLYDRNGNPIGGGGGGAGRPDVVRNPPAGGGGGAQGGGYQPYSDAALQAILHKYNPDNDGVRQAYAEVQRTFGPGVVELLEHPQRLDKFRTPTGTYDTVIGAGAPGSSWGWMREGGGASTGTLGGMAGGGLSPQGVGPVIGSPMAGRSWQDDPGVQIRLAQGLQSLERSAAAKGTLLTGGAAKAMMRFAQDYTSMEYQNAYARAASEQGNNFNRLFSVGQLGANATGNSQQLASGYADRIGSQQVAAGDVSAGATQSNGAANANTVGTLSNLAGQWLKNRYGGGGSDPNNTGGWVDAGRGLY